MEIKFPFEIKSSGIFGPVARPVAKVDFWSKLSNNWVEIIMLVDTGADYTLLPKFYAEDLGISLEKDCKPYSTFGVGGSETVYVLKSIKAKLGKWGFVMPVGFLERDNIPALLGRQNFLENFKVTFFRYTTSFSDFAKHVNPKR